MAKNHYENAISLKDNYLDALNSYGWFNYSALKLPDYENMKRLFKKMTEVDIFDYRGFHGLGYALYMQAIKESDHQNRESLIIEAANTSIEASNLKISQLNIVVDFGEIARLVNPNYSIAYHEHSLDILNDPVRSQLKANQGGLNNELLTSQGNIYIKGENQLRGWINYQLALDHLALYRMGIKPNENKTQHNYLLKKAQKLDPDSYIFPIYKDQLAVLDLILPNISKN